MRLCERCQSDPAISGKDRFCKKCKKLILDELRDVGYLETGGFGAHKGQSRTAEQRENTYETKHGTGHG